MKVLVTGAAGFIGSHLTQRLVDEGHSVRVVDNLSTGKLENLAPILDRIEWLEGDLADPDVSRTATRDIEVAFHLAAISSVHRSLRDPAACHHSNVDGTFQLLEGCRLHKVRRLIYAASSSVYGDGPQSPKHEELAPQPKSLYAVQKHLAEMYGRVYGDIFGLEFVGLRYFNVFGPRQDPSSEYSAVIPKFLQLMRRGQRPTIYGDGQTSRDFTYIEDVLNANVLALTAENVAGLCMNIATGSSISLNQLVDRINRLLGLDLQPIYEAERPGDVRHSVADLRLAEARLGYRPLWDFDEGLRRTAAALQD